MKLLTKLLFGSAVLLFSVFSQSEDGANKLFVNADAAEDENEDEDEVELDNTAPKVGENNPGVHDDNIDEENWDDESEGSINDPEGSAPVTDEGPVLSYDEQKSRAKLCLFVARINANP